MSCYVSDRLIASPSHLVSKFLKSWVPLSLLPQLSWDYLTTASLTTSERRQGQLLGRLRVDGRCKPRLPFESFLEDETAGGDVMLDP